MRLIKTFEFTDENRRRMVLGSGVRINPKTNRAQIAADDDGLYSTAPDLYVKTWLAHPESAKRWLGFQAFVDHVFDEVGTQISSVGFRLSDTGTTQYYWDGTDWVASSVLWNTEAEVSANIAEFPITTQSIQVITNLVTTTDEATPSLLAIKILYESDISFQEDIIYRSLVRTLKETIRPIADFPFTNDSADPESTFTLPALEAPYNLVAVTKVFDHNADPNHLDDLFVSYNTSTRALVLSDDIPAGDLVWVCFSYAPEVMVSTSRDYTEVAKVPAIVIGDMNELAAHQVSVSDCVVLNKTTGAAVKVPGPKQVDLEFTLRVLTDKARDLQRLQEAVRVWLGGRTLRSRGLDESFDIQTISHYDAQGTIWRSETHAARIRFRVLKTLLFDRPDEDVFAVVRFTLRGPPNVIVS